jgi:hypothetical protein
MLLSHVLAMNIADKDMAQLAQRLLHQGAEVHDYIMTTLPLWVPPYQSTVYEPWDLDAVKQLLLNHPEHLTTLEPSAVHYATAHDTWYVEFLIELGLFCVQLIGQSHFEPTTLLHCLLKIKHGDDAEIKLLARRLTQAGTRFSVDASSGPYADNGAPSRCFM